MWTPVNRIRPAVEDIQIMKAESKSQTGKKRAHQF